MDSLVVIYTKQTEPYIVAWSEAFRNDISMAGQDMRDLGMFPRPPGHGLWRWTGRKVDSGEDGVRLVGEWVRECGFTGH